MPPGGTRMPERLRPDDAGYRHAIQSFYAAQTNRHGFDHRAVGYNHPDSQLRRFQVLSEVGDLHGKRVLDVGCGMGCFLGWMWDRGIVPDYTGMDLCPDFITHATQRFERGAKGPYRFVASDLLEFSAPEPFDYVVSSGIFGYRTAHTEERVAPSIEHMLSLCREGVAVNFLSSRTPRPAARSWYVDPTVITEVVRPLSPAFTIRHDYLPNDFTLYLYARTPWPQR